MAELSNECRELLLYARELSIGDQWLGIKGLPEHAIRQLVNEGLMECRSGSRNWGKKPSSFVLTKEGRRIATQLWRERERNKDAAQNSQN